MLLRGGGSFACSTNSWELANFATNSQNFEIQGAELQVAEDGAIQGGDEDGEIQKTRCIQLIKEILTDPLDLLHDPNINPDLLPDFMWNVGEVFLDWYRSILGHFLKNLKIINDSGVISDSHRLSSVDVPSTSPLRSPLDLALDVILKNESFLLLPLAVSNNIYCSSSTHPHRHRRKRLRVLSDYFNETSILQLFQKIIVRLNRVPAVNYGLAMIQASPVSDIIAQSRLLLLEYCKFQLHDSEMFQLLLKKYSRLTSDPLSMTRLSTCFPEKLATSSPNNPSNFFIPSICTQLVSYLFQFLFED